MCVCDRIYRKRIDSVGLLIVNMMDHPKLVGGWPTPLKNMKVSWDDDIPNWMESHKIPWFQTRNQLYFW